MKDLLCSAIAAIVFWGCGPSPIVSNNSEAAVASTKTDIAAVHKVDGTKQPVQLNDLFSRQDAEKILGEPAHIGDSAVHTGGDIAEISCSYQANSADAKTGKTGNIYFMYEEYQHPADAHKVYSSIKTANEGHEGINVLEGLGDEAYFHTDGENFYFILARKGRKMFRLKVNKVTAHTSLAEFNLYAQKLADKL
jgi:hypothetical protein